MSMFVKLGSWFKIPDDEDEELYDTELPAPGKRNVVPIGEGLRRSGGLPTSPKLPMRCVRAKCAS
jgi:hypothetical protein